MRLAVVLFNLGGPDGLAAVEPFLVNLFSDPAIIGAPKPIRWLLARFIAKRRGKVARHIYERIGGSSPLLAQTEAQARALEAALADLGSVRAFIAMRYWHPLTGDTARAVAAWQPDHVVLLPLYPQFSTTTTGSSLAAWQRAAAEAGVRAPTRAICCYPTEDGFIAAMASAIKAALAEAREEGEANPRLLLTAHGLPRKVVEAGDPYVAQMERTAEAVVARLDQAGLDWRLSYQSRVGPLEWTGPYSEDEIRQAGAEGRALVVAPIAFVSEHSETLVELDMDYRELARQAGVPSYRRVATVGVAPAFIDGLACLVRKAVCQDAAIAPSGVACCTNSHGRCGRTRE